MTRGKSYIYRCPQCRTKNRIPVEKVGAPARCGKCQSTLLTKDLLMAQQSTNTGWGDFITIASKLASLIITGWANWCSACAMVSPVIEELAREWKGRIRVGKLNVEANPVLTARYDLRSLPTLLVFDAGQLRDTLVGALPKQYIVQRMAAYL